MTRETHNSLRPLCVDLDGTLIASDVLFESVILLLKKNFLYIFLLPFWAIRGAEYLKTKLADRVRPNPETLPYREEILSYLREEKARGRELVLVTASIQSVADSIAGYLAIFDSVYATTPGNNLKGQRKKELLEEKFGSKNFDYIGDSNIDIPIWKAAARAMIVNPGGNMLIDVQNCTQVEKVFHFPKNKLLTILREMRIYQWVKNVLIFLPLFLAHQWSVYLAIEIVIAFIAYSLCASSIYIINDLMDLETDRRHPRKRKRPIASGELTIPVATALAPGLLALGFALSIWLLPLYFTYILIIYVILTSAYSFWLKKIAIADLLVLASLYTLRLIAGAVAVDVMISPWLLAFSMFIFLSLAIVKRYTELMIMKRENKAIGAGRGYEIDDLSLLRSIGPASGYLAALVFAFYVNSTEVTILYKHPKLLWLVVPLMLYWITRIWLLAHRDRMHDDPIVFTVKDKTSYAIGILIAILVIGAAI
ncbi:MAG: UbiA family prenyltransferase [Candidatus Kapaibacterium sp.]